jgi:rubredoxin
MDDLRRCSNCGHVFRNKDGHLVKDLSSEEIENIPVSGTCYLCMLDSGRTKDD